MAEISDAIWVISDRTADDAYIVVVQVGPDTVINLATREAAERYVRTAFTAVAYAEYDAAVFAQMHRVTKGDVPLSASVMLDLRNRRPALDHEATAPLTFEPIVSAKTSKPFVHVALNGHLFSQWSPADAHQHATQVLDASCVVGLDADFLAYQTSELGLDLPRARAVVDQLREHREAPDAA